MFEMSLSVSVCVSEFDRHELLIYEEVAKVPPFRRKTLVLIGAQGVGRRNLKNKLLMSQPHRYGTTTPCNTRAHATPCSVSVSHHAPVVSVFTRFFPAAL